MRSPFPGMDPYLEQYWRDVHHSLVTYARDQLQGQLPGDLRARVEERATVESGTAIAEPLIIHLPDESVSEGYIEIIDVGSGNRVVTVLEVLSLSNKLPGEGQEMYLQKQRELRQGRVSLVEIDLLRAGKRVLAVPSSRIPPSHRTPYLVCVTRGWRLLTPEIYRVPLREPLPSIKVPLRETDADVRLDLQALIDQCYRNGRYDDIDYKREPDPPLDPADAGWADELLRAASRR